MKANGKIKIDKSVPIPLSRKHNNYPLDDLDVGHSFVIPGEQVQMLRMAVSQRHHRKQDGHRYTVRKWEGGYRCWRVE